MHHYFSLKASRFLTVLLLFTHLASLAVILFLPLPLWLMTIVAFCILSSLFYYLFRDAWLSLSSSCVGFRLGKRQVVVTTRSGLEFAGLVMSDSVVTPYMTLLRILPQGAHLTRNVVIFPDAIGAESFRELRVALRWEK